MEPDDAGLQPQTRLEPGELREIDGGGGLKSPAATPALEKSGQRPPITLGTHPSPGYSIRFAPPGNSATIKLPPAQPSTCPLAGGFHTTSRLVRPRHLESSI